MKTHVIYKVVDEIVYFLDDQGFIQKEFQDNCVMNYVTASRIVGGVNNEWRLIHLKEFALSYKILFTQFLSERK